MPIIEGDSRVQQDHLWLGPSVSSSNFSILSYESPGRRSIALARTLNGLDGRIASLPTFLDDLLELRFICRCWQWHILMSSRDLTEVKF